MKLRDEYGGGFGTFLVLVGCIALMILGAGFYLLGNDQGREAVENYRAQLSASRNTISTQNHTIEELNAALVDRDMQLEAKYAEIAQLEARIRDLNPAMELAAGERYSTEVEGDAINQSLIMMAILGAKSAGYEFDEADLLAYIQSGGRETIVQAAPRRVVYRTPAWSAVLWALVGCALMGCFVLFLLWLRERGALD